MALVPEDLIRVLISMFIGGMIGAEREVRDKTAGLRTLMFISVGSTIFTILSLRMSALNGMVGDPGRIAAQIVSGIGFLGAGAIIRNAGEIQGLTTASTIWLVAALGMGVGSGEYLFSLIAGVIILLALLVFPSVERLIGSLHQVQSYRIVIKYSSVKIAELIALFNSSGLQFNNRRYLRQEDTLECHWRARGRAVDHQTVMEALLADPDIILFEN